MDRKFRAKELFTGYKFLGDQHVLVTSKEGIIKDIVPLCDAGDDVRYFNEMLCPGFINCHCHLELSHMKGQIAKSTGLVDFVWNVVTGRHFDDDAIHTAIDKAEEEMWESGIVAVGDICNNTFTIPRKKSRKIYYHNFIEVSGFTPEAAPIRWQRALDIYQEFSASLSSNSITPHAPYSVSPQLLQVINDLPGNRLISMHNQEVIDEDHLFEEGSGDFIRMYEKMNIDISFFTPTHKRSLHSWLPYFTNQQSIISVHNVATTEVDIEFAKRYQKESGIDIYFCLCPNANLYISGILPPVQMFQDHNCKIVLGTDSLASNDQLSIIAEINTIQKNFPYVKTDTVLQWATSNGAAALGIDNSFGSFDKGKKPGLVLIDGAPGNFSSRRIL